MKRAAENYRSRKSRKRALIHKRTFIKSHHDTANIVTPIPAFFGAGNPFAGAARRFFGKSRR